MIMQPIPGQASLLIVSSSNKRAINNSRITERRRQLTITCHTRVLHKKTKDCSGEDFVSMCDDVLVNFKWATHNKHTDAFKVVILLQCWMKNECF